MVMVKTLQIMSFEIFSHVLAIGRLAATTQYMNRMIRKTPPVLTTFITSGIKDTEKWQNVTDSEPVHGQKRFGGTTCCGFLRRSNIQLPYVSSARGALPQQNGCLQAVSGKIEVIDALLEKNLESVLSLIAAHFKRTKS
jgi:hypothetical protein